MTTAYIPTVGEQAHVALAGFTAMLDSTTGPGAPTDRDAALGLVRACLALMDKFPRQERRQFAATLPFSALELELLRVGHVDHGPIADGIAKRLREWAICSPVLVEEANVHAADFLLRLQPLLDLSSERDETLRALQRLHAY